MFFTIKFQRKELEVLGLVFWGISLITAYCGLWDHSQNPIFFTLGSIPDLGWDFSFFFTWNLRIFFVETLDWSNRFKIIWRILASNRDCIYLAMGVKSLESMFTKCTATISVGGELSGSWVAYQSLVVCSINPSISQHFAESITHILPCSVILQKISHFESVIILL